MKRGIIVYFLIILLLSGIVAVGNVEAKETETIICEPSSPINGIDASFGFVMEYNPSEARIVENQNLELESLILSYSPSPEPVTITINFEELLDSYGIGIPTELPIDLWEVKPELTHYNIPMEDTPLGTYTLESIVIYSGNVVELVLDININGQLNASTAVTGGQLDKESFIWTEWGAKEVVFTPSETNDKAEVTTNFKYWTTLQIELYLKTYSFLGGIEQLPSFFSESVPLGEMPFDTPVSSTINIERPYTKISELESEINTLQTENTKLSTDLTNSNTDITDLNNIITQKEGTITQKDSEITQLSNEITTLNDDIDKLDSENKNLSARLESDSPTISEPELVTTTGGKGSNSSLSIILIIVILIPLIALLGCALVIFKTTRLKMIHYQCNQPVRYIKKYNDWWCGHCHKFMGNYKAATIQTEHPESLPLAAPVQLPIQSQNQQV